MVLQLWPSLSSLPLFTVIIHCTMSKPLYRSASTDCWMEALSCKLFTCLFLILHKHGLGHHRWSGNFILYCLGQVVVFCHINQSIYCHGWVMSMTLLTQEIITCNFSSRLLSNVGTTEYEYPQCDSQERPSLPPEGKMHEKWPFRVDFSDTQQVWEKCWLFLRGEPSPSP